MFGMLIGISFVFGLFCTKIGIDNSNLDLLLFFVLFILGSFYGDIVKKFNSRYSEKAMKFFDNIYVSYILGLIIASAFFCGTIFHENITIINLCVIFLLVIAINSRNIIEFHAKLLFSDFNIVKKKGVEIVDNPEIFVDVDGLWINVKDIKNETGKKEETNKRE